MSKMKRTVAKNYEKFGSAEDKLFQNCMKEKTSIKENQTKY